MELNTQLHINFIYLFKKALDSDHRESLWKILNHYGLPSKDILIISKFFERFECSVILSNSLSEPFPVESGVRQGCILSPILFLTIIDWIMRKSTSNKPRGIQWNLLAYLEDLDYADDLDLLLSNHTHLQEKTSRLQRFGQCCQSRILFGLIVYGLCFSQLIVSSIRCV